jgi:hypothetical protein
MDFVPGEYVIIEFPGNCFNGMIGPQIARLVERGTVRTLDLVCITRPC